MGGERYMMYREDKHGHWAFLVRKAEIGWVQNKVLHTAGSYALRDYHPTSEQKREHKTLIHINSGTYVNVLKLTKKWAYVDPIFSKEGKKGWIPADHLETPYTFVKEDFEPTR